MTNGTDKNSSFILSNPGSGPHLNAGKVICQLLCSHLRVSVFKVVHGVGNLPFMNLSFPPTFKKKKIHGIQICISRSLNKDLVSQNVLFNQNVIAFYRTLTRRK